MLLAANLLPGATFYTSAAREGQPDTVIARYSSTHISCVTAGGTPYLLALTATIYPC